MAQKWPPLSHWASLNGTCDQHNGSVEEARCFGRGECGPNRVAGYSVCKCRTFYDPLSFCERTIFDVLQGRDLPYPLVGYVVSTSFLALYVFEAALDRSVDPKAHKKPAFISKVLLSVFLLTQLAYFGIWHYATVNNEGDLGNIAYIVNVTGALFLVTGSYLFIISWLDLLLRVKNFGEHTLHVRRIRVTIILLLCIFVPIFFTTTIAWQAGFKPALMSLVGIGFASTLSISSMIIVFALLISVTMWIWRMDKNMRRSKRVQRIIRKNWCLFVHNLGTLFIVVPVQVAKAVLPSDLPGNFTIYSVFTSISLWVTLATFFAFLQNFLFRDGFGVSYIQALRGKSISTLSDASTAPHHTAQTRQTQSTSLKSADSYTQTSEPDAFAVHVNGSESSMPSRSRSPYNID